MTSSCGTVELSCANSTYLITLPVSSSVSALSSATIGIGNADAEASPFADYRPSTPFAYQGINSSQAHPASLLSQRVRRLLSYPYLWLYRLTLVMLALPRNYLQGHVPTATLLLLTFAVPGAHASPVAQTLALGNQRARREPSRLGANPGALGAQSSRRAGHPAARSPRRERSAIQPDVSHSDRRNSPKNARCCSPARQPTWTGCVRHGRAAARRCS